MRRSSFINRYTPIKAKRVKPSLWNHGRKPGDDPKYRNWINHLPCVVCMRGWLYSELAEAIAEAADLSAQPVSECAHVGTRGLGQKCSDRQSIPLCAVHRRTGPDAHHVLGKAFWAVHSLDRDDLIRKLQALYRKA